MIAAVGKNLELGVSNALMWHLPDDFAWFIKHTKGKPVIMGRKTMESLGKPLKNRTNIVLTSQAHVLPGFELSQNWEQALALAHVAIESQPSTVPAEIMIIGGGEIYKQALGFSNRMYLTKVDASFDQADTFYPMWTDENWKLDHCEHHSSDERHAFAFDLCIFNRKMSL